MRTTITINDKLFKAAKIHALESGSSFSSLAEEAITSMLLEDLSDAEIAKRREAEPVLSFNNLVKDLKKEGLIE